MWLVLLLVVIASAHDHHGHSHDHHGHSHDHHGHAQDHHGHAHDHHGHAHGNLGEAPNFKWSKQANTDEKAHSHDPPAPSPEKKSTKEHSHDNHGHSHENHGHSQENHGHSHDNHGNSHESHGHSHGEEKDHKETYTPPKKAAVLWFEPLLATAAISMAPFLILFLVPLDSNSEENKPFLKILLAFASGGLLGDAFLHLIPHAVSPHSHGGDDHGHSHQDSHEDHGHDHSADMMVGLWVLTGLIVFLVVEKLVRHLKGGHGHSHGPKVKDDSDKKDKKEEKKGAKKENGKDSKENEDKDCDSTDKEENIKVAAYLNLAADFMHNFTDGLAIGVSFLVSLNVGLITTLTIFLHEIPHEIGDFAILIQSGCTKRKAMMLQLVTAMGAFAGCICGLLAEGLGAAASGWILPFTAGGFIYIATVSVIPELLEESRLTQSIKEITALLVGVFLMVIIATME